MNPQKRGLLLPFAAAAALAGLAVLLLLRPQAVAAGVRLALARCYDSLIPALFPFLVLTQLAAGSGAAAVLGLPLAPYCRALGIRSSREAGTALGLGLLGGFAAGGCAVAALCRRGRLDGREASLLLCAAAGESPAFVLLAVGAGLLGSLRLGTALLLSLTGASLLSALGMRFFVLLPVRRGQAAAETASLRLSPAPESAAAQLVAAVGSAVDAMLRICGFVLLFGALLALLPAGAPQGLKAVCASLLEVSAGCAAGCLLPGKTALTACAAALSLLGLSAFAQLRALLPAEVGLGPLALSRLLHLPLTLLLLWPLLRVLPAPEAPAAVQAVQRLVLPLRLPREAAFFLFLLLAVFCCETTAPKGTLRRRAKHL